MRVDIQGSPFPKLRYGSAGNLYPVQAYVHAAPGRVEGLAGRRLLLRSRRPRPGPPGRGGADRPSRSPPPTAPLESGFALFLVARMAAIAPLYGELSRRFVALEAGLMAELLAGVAAEHGLALPAGPAGEAAGALREVLDLEESHLPVQTLLLGFPDPEREAPPAEPLAAGAAAAGGAGLAV